MAAKILVKKRDGRSEELNLNKLHRVVEFACEDINGVSASQIELRAELQFFTGITTAEIQETLIKSAADLITEETPNYQYVASRLINYDLRKRVYGQFDPWPLFDLVKRNVALGFYDPELLELYTKEEYEELDSYLRHERDYNIAYAGMEQFRRKYLIQNKITGEILETPQMAYMLIGATAFAREPKDRRMTWIRRFYNHASKFDFSLPTPIMAGVRSPDKQFSSCVLVDVDDSLKSISASGAAIMEYAAKRAGLGVNVGRIRAVNSDVRGGKVRHTGIVPFIKFLIAALKSCNQGGIRTASGNFCFPMWHYEYEDLVVLKNNRGTEETRARSVDYTVQVNKVLLNRLLEGKDISFFSPKEVPGLYDAFFRSNEEFEELYVKYEADKSIRRRTLTALDAFTQLILERKETGRIYVQFVDNTNELGTFTENALVYMTNLCTEITEPTKPLQDFNDEGAEIALCTLAAYNLGNIKEPADFKNMAQVLVRFLDNILTYQEYPIEAAHTSSNRYRNLGIGIINLAYFLAKHNKSYTDPSSLEFIHPFVEAMAYYTIDASIDLATERGPCLAYENTKWSRGILPIDKYRPFMDGLVKNELLLDWEALRTKLAEHGIRNSTLMTGMPAETSAQIANATNGFEPPRALVSVKVSKDGTLKQVVPEIQRLKNKYELLWDQKSPVGYLNIVGVFNKFFCQSISTNTSYNPAHFDDGQIPMSVLLQDIIYAYQLGLRTLYYNNEEDMSGELDVAKVEEEIKVVEEIDVIADEDCDACVL